ncbi:MAG: SprY [Caudovirales sp. ctOwN3]|nr:MAG: SprY [Caudovirales sp. ctOwN3]
MSLLQNSNAIEAGGYTIQRSLRFRASASAYLNRTPASAGNRKTWTWSGWVKRGTLGSIMHLFYAGTYASNNFFDLYFNQSGVGGASPTDALEIYSSVSGQILYYTTQSVRRDPSGWYHVVLAIDTTQPDAGLRVLLYVNGVQLTDLTGITVPPQNQLLPVNNTVAHTIGATTTPGGHFDGYLAEVNFIDGQALTPSSFGQTDATTGVWTAKKYTGTYGTNGFYLPFTNTSTTSTLVADSSGNGNNWTPNNISLTAGVTYDSMYDSPSLTTSGTQPVGNYCVLNPIDMRSGNTISNANLQIAISTTNVFGCRATMAVSSGKWYWEMTPTANVAGAGCDIGIDSVITPITTNGIIGATSTSYGYRESGQKVNAGSSTSYGSSYTTNDVIGVALDLDAGTLVFYKNNVSQGTAFSSLSGTFTAAVSDTSGSQGVTIAANFGQRPFAYTPPTGFKALCTANLPDVAITSPREHFGVVTQLGSAVNTGANLLAQFTDFTAGFAWGKDRAASNNHQLVDTVRGNTAVLQSNTTAAETTYTAPTSGDNCVAWAWKANGSGVTNTAGSITSTVSANQTAGFSIVTYTGTGANATVGHGLGAVPSFIITKQRSAVSGAHWRTYHKSLSANGSVYLNLTNAYSGTDAGFMNLTSPTSSVFSLGIDGNVNGASQPHIAYCFSEIPGYSKFGSYTGNGSSDGPFVYCGFRPKYVMYKRTDSTGNWAIQDTSINTYNQAGTYLLANAADAEVSGSVLAIDFLSNGFKVRTTQANQNANGGTYIYMAFAETPTKFALAR